MKSPSQFILEFGSKSMDADIRASGKLDVNSGAELVAALQAAVDHSAGTQLVVDIANVSFIDSHGIRALVTATTYAERHRCTLVLSSPTTTTQRVVDLTHAGKHLTII